MFSLFVTCFSSFDNVFTKFTSDDSISLTFKIFIPINIGYKSLLLEASVAL